MYGWLTNTGVKFVIVVDMEGRPASALDSKTATAVGLRDADMKPVSLEYHVLLRSLTFCRHLGHCRPHTSNCSETRK